MASAKTVLSFVQGVPGWSVRRTTAHFGEREESRIERFEAPSFYVVVR